MTFSSTPGEEAQRLEQLWAGDFGDDYVDRNASAYTVRGEFWTTLQRRHGFESALEIGCNVGGNLEWLTPILPSGSVYGIDINRKAIGRLHERLPEANAVWSPGRELPFRDRWFDLVFTMGVLIHQPDETLPDVMAEMVRTSSRWVLCGEYFADETVEVPYHGHEGALFKRDYGRLFAESFSDELRQVDTGFLSKDEGWDDVTWWLFERTVAE